VIEGVSRKCYYGTSKEDFYPFGGFLGFVYYKSSERGKRSWLKER
jgi:hypothetical protein